MEDVLQGFRLRTFRAPATRDPFSGDAEDLTWDLLYGKHVLSYYTMTIPQFQPFLVLEVLWIKTVLFNSN